MAGEVRARRRRRAGHKHSGKTRISSKNQVTIPVAVLREVGLEAGETVEVVPIAPGVFEIRREKSRLDEFVGILDGLEKYIDIEADRAGWAERDAEIHRRWVGE